MHRYTAHDTRSWPQTSMQMKTFITDTDTNSTKSITVLPFLIAYLCVCECVHMPVCTWWIPPAPELTQSALESICIPTHNPSRVAVLQVLVQIITHTHKTTDAIRYSNQRTDHVIPPAVLWNSLDSLKTSSCCGLPLRDTQIGFLVTSPTQLAHLAYLQNKSHSHNGTCPSCYL